MENLLTAFTDTITMTNESFKAYPKSAITSMVTCIEKLCDIYNLSIKSFEIYMLTCTDNCIDNYYKAKYGATILNTDIVSDKYLILLDYNQRLNYVSPDTIHTGESADGSVIKVFMNEIKTYSIVTLTMCDSTAQVIKVLLRKD